MPPKLVTDADGWTSKAPRTPKAIGHKLDVCPNSNVNRCKICGHTTTDSNSAHHCKPGCPNCGKDHAADDPDCETRKAADQAVRRAAYLKRLRHRQHTNPEIHVQGETPPAPTHKVVIVREESQSPERNRNRHRSRHRSPSSSRSRRRSRTGPTVQGAIVRNTSIASVKALSGSPSTTREAKPTPKQPAPSQPTKHLPTTTKSPTATPTWADRVAGKGETRGSARTGNLPQHEKDEIHELKRELAFLRKENAEFKALIRNLQQPRESVVEAPTPVAPAVEPAPTTSSNANRAAKRRAAEDPADEPVTMSNFMEALARLRADIAADRAADMTPHTLQLTELHARLQILEGRHAARLEQFDAMIDAKITAALEEFMTRLMPKIESLIDTIITRKLDALLMPQLEIALQPITAQLDVCSSKLKRYDEAELTRSRRQTSAALTTPYPSPNAIQNE
ncbi:hypothetical protein HPB49_002765 [Dermacentor silvarum]|uniref:Uncharacterized protein n=1 Tax=Dermacentor silvarum TaxID=543639 RepID=A0ACB8DAD4_DERSI|nr:hypothetical protein HPB49_002765 [Dermacentor silvarum]